MRTKALIHILRKEFLQLVRTPAMVAILIICPIVTIGLVPFGLGFKTYLKLEIVDYSSSGSGTDVFNAFAGSPNVTSIRIAESEEKAVQDIKHGKCDALIVLNEDGEMSITVDGSHLLHAMNTESFIKRILSGGQEELSEGFELRPHFLYVSCEDNKHHYLMAMTIMLMAIVSCCLAAFSVVRELESKVFEHLRSTGLDSATYVLSKVLFFVLVSLLELAAALIIAHILFGLDSAGPLSTVVLLVTVFLFTMANLGISLAVCGKTLVRAIYLIVFSFLIMMPISTMFAPLDNMAPFWAATRFANPFFWGIDGLNKIMLKDVGIQGALQHICILAAMSMALFTFNVKSLGKTD